MTLGTGGLEVEFATRRAIVRGAVAAVSLALGISFSDGWLHAQAAPAGCGLDMRVLVLSADGTEADLPAITQTLNYLSTPYTTYVVKQRPGELTPTFLANGCHGNFQAVIAATGNVDNIWANVMSAAEIQALHNFESAYGVRHVVWYTYPNDFGLTSAVDGFDTTAHPLTVRLTRAGSAVFPYINRGQAGSPASPLTIQSATAYPALLVPGFTTTPLITDSSGNVFGAITTYGDGREILALTFDSNPNLLQALVFGYGLVNWATRGMFVGERHVYMSPQVDDVFIADDKWVAGTSCALVGHDQGANDTGPTIRMTGDDLRTAAAWQLSKNLQPTTANFRLTMAFNGWGATGVYHKDSLTKTAKSIQHLFYWVSHTYDHATLDGIGYDAASAEFTMNNEIAARLRLSRYSPKNIVTPNVSGLKDPQVMQAAADAGIRYLVTDTSIAGQDNPFPNVGIYNWMQPNLLMIPRRPVNLFYNVATPADWASEYNCIYHSYFGRDLSYQEILDFVSDQLLPYLLRGENDPWMFHQPNLVAYDGQHSLLTDLLDLVLAKYNGYFNLPIVSPTMDSLGKTIATRMDRLAANVQATLQPGVSLTLASDREVTVPVTGLSVTGAELYGGQPIAWVQVPAGQSVAIPLSATAPPIAPGLPNPPNGATDISASPTPTLTWSGLGAIDYDVRFGTSNPPPQVSSAQVTTSYTPAALAASTTYFWQIVARNGAGTTTGPIWTFTTAAPANIVIYASDVPASALHGAWMFANDPTAANGMALITPDNIGVSNLDSALAAPAHYFDVTFAANAGTPYRIWIRLKALDNSKWNDSIWVQFSDATAGGSAVYSLNTSSGLNVNLATDVTATSLNGWGWQNTAYWLNQPTTLTFSSAAMHTMRIQVREDGVQLDQILLSPTTYLINAPGSVTNDGTIVPKP
jgi:hypothetical protein